MKRLILLSYILMSLIFCKGIIAQHPYIPMPMEDVVWVVEVLDEFGQFQSAKNIFISGDTLIGVNRYSKIYSSGDSILNPVDDYLAGFIRQDTVNEKVYRLPIFSLEHLLYDFNINVGDTMKGWGQYQDGTSIIQIDSIIQKGVVRYVYNVDGNNNSFVEGVGSLAGILQTAKIFEGRAKLKCMFRKSTKEVLFSNSFEPCELYHLPWLGEANDNSKMDKLQAIVSPNPINNQSIIKLTAVDDQIESIEIYDSVGNLIYSKQALNTPSLELQNIITKNGIYFSRLKTTNNIHLSNKIIKSQ